MSEPVSAPVFEAKDLKALLYRRVKDLDVRESIRLFHGRGRCYKGLEFLTIDLFWPVVHITLHRTPEDTFLWSLVNDILDLLVEKSLRDSLREQLKRGITPVSTAVDRLPIRPNDAAEAIPSEQAVFQTVNLQFRGGKSSHTLRLGKPLPSVHHAIEEGARFIVDLQRNQNVGFFLDMKPVRDWLRSNCEQKKVLNLFAYTCAFSVAALQGRARAVVNVDMSARSMAWGRANHRLNQLDSRSAVFLSHEIFRSWGKIRKHGPYDIVIIDPPSFQPGSFVAETDYPRIVKKVDGVLSPKGVAIVALNSPKLGLDFIHDILATHLPALKVEKTFAAADYFTEPDPDKELKVVLCRRES